MRVQLLGLILLASIAAPVGAQNSERIERRVGKLEDEMRAVQRKVFPNGTIQPEILPPQQDQGFGGIPATSPVADLTERVDALERQLATLTGQVEENGHRTRQLEEQVSRLRSDMEARIAAAERASAPPQPALPEPAEPNSEPNAAADPKPAGSGDPAEDAYLAGFRLWETAKFAEAQKALEAVAKQHPKHRRASWAQNLAGRAYLDGGKPATAAKVLLANYQNNPKGERAADSLLFLGEALVQLKKPTEACQVYAELQDVYGATMRDFVKQRLPAARKAANCS